MGMSTIQKITLRDNQIFYGNQTFVNSNEFLYFEYIDKYYFKQAQEDRFILNVHLDTESFYMDLVNFNQSILVNTSRPVLEVYDLKVNEFNRKAYLKVKEFCLTQESVSQLKFHGDDYQVIGPMGQDFGKNELYTCELIDGKIIYVNSADFNSIRNFMQ